MIHKELEEFHIK